MKENIMWRSSSDAVASEINESGHVLNIDIDDGVYLQLKAEIEQINRIRAQYEPSSALEKNLAHNYGKVTALVERLLFTRAE